MEFNDISFNTEIDFLTQPELTNSYDYNFDTSNTSPLILFNMQTVYNDVNYQENILSTTVQHDQQENVSDVISYENINENNENIMEIEEADKIITICLKEMDDENLPSLNLIDNDYLQSFDINQIEDNSNIITSLQSPIHESGSSSRDASYEEDSSTPSPSSSSLSSESISSTKTETKKRRGRPLKTDIPVPVYSEEDLKDDLRMKYINMRIINNISSRRSRQNRKRKETELEEELHKLETRHTELINLEKQLTKEQTKYRNALLKLARF